MDDILKQSLEASKLFFSNASEEEIQSILSELGAFEYEGQSIDEFLACSVELNGFSQLFSSRIHCQVSKTKMKNGMPYDKDFSSLLKKKNLRWRYRKYYTNEIIKARGQKSSLSFYICP